MTQKPASIKQKRSSYDTELLARIEGLIRSFQGQVRDAQGEEREDDMVYGLRVLVALANMVLSQKDVFGIEPWHVIAHEAPLSMPGEMLLRVKDFKDNPMPPYKAIMAFYDHGYTAQIDGILFLAAIGQFERMRKAGLEKQVTINISARSLRDADFVKATLARLEGLHLASDEKVLIEIHESAPHLSLSRQVLELYRVLGVGFVLDDVGMNMNDVLRLADFEGLADYIKLDRHTVCAPEGGANALDQVMSFVETLMPGSVCVAEGVQNAEHALEIVSKYPSILYAQGLYLPDDRTVFQRDFLALASAQQIAVQSDQIVQQAAL